MKSDAEFERLREASWRRKLTPAEEAQLRLLLAAHPEAQADWENEVALNEAIERLRPAPISSNFTSRVIQAAVKEANTGQELKPAGLSWLGRLRWLPRLGFASAIVAAGLFGYYEIHQVRLGEIRDSLVTISEVPSPNPEILQDFEAIQVMSQTPKADEDLIRLFQ